MSTSGAPRPLLLAAGLGSVQLIAWGTLYYSIAVLGPPIQRDLGLSSAELYGAFAWSLALSGVLAPWAGQLVDRGGGRLVLTASVLIGALGFGLLACAHSLPMLALGWTVQGVAMALGLYDTCFAALGQVAVQSYRRSVTTVTLIAGLASTVFWPVSHYALKAVQWRGTYLAFAGLLVTCAPLYLVLLPRGSPATPRDHTATTTSAATGAARLRARLLSLAFAGAALVSGALSAHLVSTLAALQFSSTQAVWIAASVGVMQVVGRWVELWTSRLSVHRLSLLTFSGVLVSILFLMASQAVPSLVLLFVLTYGAANGVITIVKALLPVELLGTHQIGTVLGRFSAPSLIARAGAPWAFALVQSSKLGTMGALSISVLVAAASLAAFVKTSRRAVSR